LRDWKSRRLACYATDAYVPTIVAPCTFGD